MQDNGSHGLPSPSQTGSARGLHDEVDPEQRMVELDQENQDGIDEALDNEREPGFDGTDAVEDEDVDEMMEHL